MRIIRNSWPVCIVWRIWKKHECQWQVHVSRQTDLYDTEMLIQKSYLQFRESWHSNSEELVAALFVRCHNVCYLFHLFSLGNNQEPFCFTECFVHCKYSYSYNEMASYRHRAIWVCQRYVVYNQCSFHGTNISVPLHILTLRKHIDDIKSNFRSSRDTNTIVIRKYILVSCYLSSD